MVRTLNKSKMDEKQIEQQQEIIDNLEKLRDTLMKQATENAEKVSIFTADSMSLSQHL